MLGHIFASKNQSVSVFSRWMAPNELLAPELSCFSILPTAMSYVSVMVLEN